MATSQAWQLSIAAVDFVKEVRSRFHLGQLRRGIRRRVLEEGVSLWFG
jgi:hypothetical protein